MTSMVSLQDQCPDIYVSTEPRQSGQPIWNLLAIGWFRGFPTSITETESILQPDVISRQFHDLAEIVRSECAHLSSIREIALHPAYQQIIGMGPRALPLILRELEHNPGHWFWALRSITQEDPVFPNHQGVASKMTQDWLKWAHRKGLQW